GPPRGGGAAAFSRPAPAGPPRIRAGGGGGAAGVSPEISPPHRLVFTWGWTHDPAVPPGTTRVVITLQPEDGGTRVVLRHHDLPDDKQGEHHPPGGEFSLRRLAGLTRGEGPGPDPDARPPAPPPRLTPGKVTLAASGGRELP